MLIERKLLDMELDTGASVGIIPKSVRCDVLAVKPFLKTDVKLRSYSRYELPVVGEGKVQVSNGSQQACLLIIATATDSPVLMGQNWVSI